MMLRNLSWGNWKENMKRRNWTALLCLVCMFFALPIQSMITMSSRKNNSYFETMSVTQQMEFLQTVYQNGIAWSDLLVLTSCFFGLLFAVQGFSWLFSGKKTDLYCSVPVSAQRRYFLIYMNGIGFYAVSYITALVCAWITGAANGVLTAEAVFQSILSFGVQMLGFLVSYHIAIIAVMLCGNILVTLLAYVVFCVYETAVRLLYSQMCTAFYKTYNILSDQGELYFATPVRNYGRIFNLMERDVPDWTTLFLQGAVLILWILVLGGLAYILYRKRPTESYNRSLAFPSMKGVVRFLLLVPFSLIMGCWFSRMAGEGVLFFVLGMLIGLLGGHCIIQLIYEADLRAVLWKKSQLLLAGAVTVLIFVVFQYDLTGYDSYIPDKNKIASVAVTHDSYGANHHYDFEYGIWTRPEQQTMEHMRADDEALIDAVLQMAEEDRRLQVRDDYEDSDYVRWDVRYALKNGRVVYRKIRFKPKQLEEAVNTVYRNEEFQNSRYQIFEEQFEQNLGKMQAEFTTGVKRYAYSGDMYELLETMRKDFRTYDLTTIMDALPVGKLTFYYHPKDDRTYDYEKWEFPVYRKFTGMMALLEKSGTYDMEEDGNGLLPEEIKYIDITNEHREMVSDGNPLIREAAIVNYAPVTEQFTDKNEIARILPALYPSELYEISGRELYSHPREEELDARVEVDRKALNIRAGFDEWSNENYYVVLKDKMPQFVWERTARE